MTDRLYVGIESTVGHTPLVRLDRLAALKGREDLNIWAKLESFNPGGSAKDRTAAGMVADAIATGRLRPGSIAVESSSGNLGVALAREAVLHDFTFHCVVDPRANRTTVAHMRALGAVVHEVTEPDPETSDWLTARRQLVEKLLTEYDGAINFDQYSNRAAFAAHRDGTMAEIIADLGHAPDHVFVAVSTTGTLGGCLAATVDTPTEVHAVDAEGSVLFGGKRGVRPLPGYGAGVVTELSTQVTPRDIARIDARSAISAARELAACEAILPGASGGAVLAALDAALPDYPAGADVVAILHDNGTAYLSTIYDDTWVEENV